ncbi:hypothetical protein VE00_10460 [Pseudogymnoascus sp. WSF 3629]|nr:hypothetical protein VE00_10460 [Pseudogymnoascus sp. WSF 3629]
MGFTPIIVGVGDVRNKAAQNPIEPVDLMLEAIRLSLIDCNLSPSNSQRLQSDIDSVDVVACSTWPYHDLPGLVSERLGVDAKHKHYTPSMGNQPVKLLNDMARRIVTGESKVAMMTGGETLASLRKLEKAGKFPPPGWTKPGQDMNTLYSPNALDLLNGTSRIHTIGTPIQVYPLFETGFRAHRHQSYKENMKESAALYGEFAKVAEKHPRAWSYGEKTETEETIGTVSDRNRMVYSPSACIVTSTEHAEKLGIPKSKWIYPLGGAWARDSEDFYNRPNYYSSPAISQALDSGLENSGLTKEAIDMFDFYSCFPIVPKLACEHLGIPQTNWVKPITLLGGLTSFGGAGANYSMHAVAEMVQQLRSAHGKRNGLILANGGVASYENTVCLSNSPRQDGIPYPQDNVLLETPAELPCPPFDMQAEGPVTIETYTVEHDRNNNPIKGYVVCLLKSNGHRIIANHADTATLQELSNTTQEQIGRSGFVRQCADVKGRNLFSFGTTSKL